VERKDDDEENAKAIHLPDFPEGWTIRRRARLAQELRDGAKSFEQAAAETGLPEKTVREWISGLNVLRSFLRRK
jgi:hypothetical protein